MNRPAQHFSSDHSPLTVDCDLSVVVPVFNEEPENLKRLLEALAAVLSPLKLSYEVVFVDDGSQDATASVLRRLAGSLDYVQLLVMSRNFGELAALNAGLDHARGRAVVSMDSDLQDPPAMLPIMIRYWQEGYDVVLTRQASRKDSPLKNFTAGLFYRVLGAASDVQIPLDVAEFRLLSRKAVDALHRLPEKSRFLRGMVPWIGFNQIIIPFHRQARVVGQGHYTLGKLLTLALDGLITYCTSPLFLIAPVGILLMLAGGAALAAAAIWHLPATGSMIISAFLFFTGLQVFCLGIVAAYLSHLLTETRARPTYLVSEQIDRRKMQDAVESFRAPANISL